VSIGKASVSRWYFFFNYKSKKKTKKLKKTVRRAIEIKAFQSRVVALLAYLLASGL
jgi:hypothetical protein